METAEEQHKLRQIMYATDCDVELPYNKLLSYFISQYKYDI